MDFLSAQLECHVSPVSVIPMKRVTSSRDKIPLRTTQEGLAGETGTRNHYLKQTLIEGIGVLGREPGVGFPGARHRGHLLRELPLFV
jgi:hypothetical protein